GDRAKLRVRTTPQGVVVLEIQDSDGHTQTIGAYTPINVEPPGALWRADPRRFVSRAHGPPVGGPLRFRRQGEAPPPPPAPRGRRARLGFQGRRPARCRPHPFRPARRSPASCGRREGPAASTRSGEARRTGAPSG